MGFGFRKSFSSGPFRFTVSPRGVSSSFGIRGARITAGPRGTFVTISSHGAYYRHRIDSPASRASAPGSPKQPASSGQEFVQSPLDSVFQVPVSEIDDALLQHKHDVLHEAGNRIVGLRCIGEDK